MSQRFLARVKREFSNGAIGYAPGGPFDCLGPFAKVKNCPVMIDGQEVDRLTCYASGYANTYFSVPASTRKRGKHVTGFFTSDGAVVVFHPMDRCKNIWSK